MYHLMRKLLKITYNAIIPYIQGVSEETVFQIQNAGKIKPVKITNVLILVERPAGLVLNARSRTMWLFADVLEDLQEIHSR